MPKDKAGPQERQLVLHGLVIQRFASAGSLGAITGFHPDRVSSLLQQLSNEGLAKQREGRVTGWSPTAEGKQLHKRLLEGPLGAEDPHLMRIAYDDFSPLNGTFKELCTRWQLRDSEGASPVPNDHDDPAYDRAVIEELVLLDVRAADLVERMSTSLRRVTRYGDRMEEALDALKQGDRDKFTKPLSESYHDIWMELQEDLVLTLGLQRTAADA